ncbi:MAG TPA: UDP-glucose 4-epimerase GalE [Terriglobales bacterium]|jgi:UDP-glucose 4-epimerase|nr:UDP-glucose 4-epimerase GalE [Terriglobales bacterium]
MKILVTGGAGYIGSVVAGELLQAGHQVVVFDNLNHGHRQAVPDNAELIVGDLADRAAVDDLFKSRAIDAVMHFAALIEAGESMKAPATFFRNNTANALTILEAMLAAGVKRFVFSSTAALYGNPERTPIEEDDLLNPTNAYGESKLLVERMLAWFHRIHGLRYASLRYFNAAGASRPDQGEAHHPETHLLPRILNVALGRATNVNIFGTDYPTPDGTCVRDYIHVSDLSHAHLLALDALKDAAAAPEASKKDAFEEFPPLIYNLGNGQGFSVREVVDVARQVTGHPIPVIESPRREGDPAILIASSEKIRRELGWQPKFPELKTIVESAWQWHRRHPDGYETIG